MPSSKRRKPPYCAKSASAELCGVPVVVVEKTTDPFASSNGSFEALDLGRGRDQHPTALWTARQLVETCGIDESPRFLVRDRDAVCGEAFTRKAAALGILEVPTAVRSPWQNPYAERVIGSIRRECLDHVVILGERHLRRLLRGYSEYYHRAGTHLSLVKDTPAGRPAQRSTEGRVIALEHLGGLHHEYVRLAA